MLEPSVSTVDFAGVVLSSSGFGSVRFENQGDEPLTLAGARLEPADVTEFSIRNSTCGAGSTLEAGAGCDVELEFRAEGDARLRAEQSGGTTLGGAEPGDERQLRADERPEAGDCVEGETSLASGESCSARVDFQPSIRQAEIGGLTISSALAGAAAAHLRADLRGSGAGMVFRRLL